MKKSQITIFLFATMFFGINIFAQNETPNKNDVAEPGSIAVDDDKEICDYTNKYCRKRSEILANIQKIKKEIADREKKIGKDDFGFFLGYYTGLGIEYFILQDYSNALSIFNKLEPEFHTLDLEIYRGLIYLEQGKNDEALKNFDLATKGNKSYPLAYFGRAEVFRHKRRYDEALEDYNRALEKEFRFSKALFGRGIVNLKKGEILRQNKNEYLAEIEYKNALKDFDTVIEIELNRTTPETYLYRSKVYEALGDDAKAEQDREKYEELNKKGER